ncbi:MAG: hypothetical protein DWQ02_27815 [Bacteroidetes bacterium]|nr:MAG: hypothetical protein DWQ02_27815 [Bacteroidota bacterium]
MCTVTYIPGQGKNFVLTSNRDEAPGRSADEFGILETDGIKITFPRDKGAGGTWIAMASSDRVVCLLNGSYKKHSHQPPYKRSRGIMVLDFFKYAGAKDFFDQYDFDGMEPFTLVIVEYGKLWELRWDEESTHVKSLDAADFHLWASWTLYDETAQQKRLDWFEAWKRSANGEYAEKILDFHQTAGDGDIRNDVVMNRDGRVQTIGITRVEKSDSAIGMVYYDLLNEQQQQTKLELNRELVK